MTGKSFRGTGNVFPDTRQSFHGTGKSFSVTRQSFRATGKLFPASPLYFARSRMPSSNLRDSSGNAPESTEQWAILRNRGSIEISPVS